MYPNPYDPRDRTDLSKRERIALEITDGVLHGDRHELIDQYVAEGYIQHTVGVGQGRQGLKNFLQGIIAKRPGRTTWRPIHLFESGDFVILHKLLPAVVIADFFRFDENDMLIEHWDVVQPLPKPDYDPMEPSEENFERFYELYKVPREG